MAYGATWQGEIGPEASPQFRSYVVVREMRRGPMAEGPGRLALALLCRYRQSMREHHPLSSTDNTSTTGSPPSGARGRGKVAPLTMLASGLVLLIVGFTMLDRGWLADRIAPLGPIDHPAAAIVGLIGLALCVAAAELLRSRTNVPWPRWAPSATLYVIVTDFLRRRRNNR